MVSFSAVLAPPGMQLIDREPGTVGPQIVRQYRELPRLTENSIDAADDRAARDGDYRRYLSLWQANLVRQVGARGGATGADRHAAGARGAAAAERRRS